MLQGKTIVLGITGGIAAYKSAELVRALTKQGADIHVIMTKSATHFIGAVTFQTLTGNPVHVDQFNLIDKSEIGHISLADRADLFLICPATANIMGKAANGIADDLLSTTIMATKAPVVFAPAMNVNMWASPAFQANLKRLTEYGFHIVEPGVGELACKWIGKGRLAELDDIQYAVELLLTPKPLKDKKIVISAGPTQEPFDPVRFLSNRSTGKMGYALAKAASLLGAEVTLVAGPTSEPPFNKAAELVWVETASDMHKAVKSAFEKADALIMCAAVADFSPENPKDVKMIKSDIKDTLTFVRNTDIVADVAKDKGNKLVVGFAAQTDDLKRKALDKIKAKNLDFIVANDVSRADIGFKSDDNEIRIFGADGSDVSYPKKSKSDLAFDILHHVFKLHES